MRAHEEHALVMARWLEAHPGVKRVLYPGLESHPQHELATQQMENFSGMISFQVHDQNRTANRMIEEFEVIHYAVSLGHHRSLMFLIGTDEILQSSFRGTGEASGGDPPGTGNTELGD